MSPAKAAPRFVLCEIRELGPDEYAEPFRCESCATPVWLRYSDRPAVEAGAPLLCPRCAVHVETTGRVP